MFFAFFLVRVIIEFIITRTRKNAKHILPDFQMIISISLVKTKTVTVMDMVDINPIS